MIRKTFGFVFISAIIFWSLPYLVGFIIGGSDPIFTGFLINIPDGNSYLAKMEIGWRGDWIFTLPYTAEPGEGAYVFLFYIFLGHLSRLTGISTLVIYHLARLISDGLMVWSLWRFSNWFFGDRWQKSSSYFPLMVFGSGLGWLASPFFGMTSDLWVAEAFPGLAGFVNPHFPLGICLILEILMRSFSLYTNKARVSVAVLGLLLASIMPFGVVVIGVVLVGTATWEWFATRKLYLKEVVFPLLLGGIYLIYQFIMIQTDPVLQQWNAQNITSSPPIWDFVVSFSPLILLALAAAWLKRRECNSLPWRMILTWLVLGFFLIYFPFSLQRRFLTSYFVPVSLVGISGISVLVDKVQARKLIPVLVIVSLLTNVLVWSSAWFGLLTRNPNVFLTRDEQEALTWLDRHAETGSVVAAGAFIGMVIPGKTALRVVYGHPFETVNAEQELAFINSFYSGKGDTDQFLAGLVERNVQYIFRGEREAELGTSSLLNSFPVVFENTTVKIFQLPP